MNKTQTNPDSLFLSVDDARKKYNFSRGMLMKLSEEANAKIKIGKIVRIDSSKLEEHIRNKYYCPKNN